MSSVRPIIAEFSNLADTVRAAGVRRRLIGFDVFDTLLRRRIEPETIKDLTARHLVRLLTGLPSCAPLRSWGMPDWKLLREKRRVLERDMGLESEIAGYDHEFRIRELMPRWIRRCALPGVPEEEIARLSEATLEHEIGLESRATLPTPGIAKTLETARLLTDRIIFVSDSYLALADIQRLLAHSGLLEFFDEGFVSSELLLTKRSGKLFQHVLRTYHLAPTDVLFIGDNPYADRDAPASLGLQPILIQDRPEQARRTRLQIADTLARNNTFWAGRHAREVIECLPTRLFPCNSDADSPHYRLGAMLAPSFMAFTLNILEEAHARNLRRIFFLSREGLTFLRMYRRIVRALKCEHVAPKAEYAVVSRASTFLASSDSFDIPALERIWWQYHGQSLDRILKNFSLPLELFAPIARKAGISDTAAPIHDLHGNLPLRRFFDDPETQRLFLQHRDTARELFSSYLADRGWFAPEGQDPGAVGIVDIGWKGSIQNNIFRALRSRPDAPSIVGFYFGLTHLPHDDDPRNQKFGFMADTRSGDWTQECIFKNGSVFEMFSTAMHGSAAGYRRLENGRVKATIKIEQAEEENFNSHFADVKRGLEDYVSEMADVLPLLDIASTDLRPQLLDQLRRYILYPTGAEARAFLEYTHVENFGVFKVSDYAWKGSWTTILKGPPAGMPRRLLHELRQQLWQEGIVRRSNVPLGNLLYDLIETRRACKW